MNALLLDNIRTLLGSLSHEIRLLDHLGRSLVPADAADFYLPEQLPAGDIVPFRGSFYLRLAGEDGLILLSGPNPQAEDMLRLAESAVASLIRLQPPQDALQAAYLRLVAEQPDPLEQAGLIREHRIPDQLPRCVLLLRPQAVRQPAYDFLRDLVPLGEQDVLLPLDRGCAILIQAMEDGQGPEEAEEFARALEETVREESGQGLHCGIGDVAPRAADLRQSYAQALRMLEIGPAFLPGGSVYAWRSMLLARFLAEVPPERARYYHGLLFNKRTASLFSEEMLETAAMFLEKNLNLSDTARQLYIHRNTLVYRLDKIQRRCGLDLRRFEDAFLFKLLLDLNNTLMIPNKRPEDGR
ncbi:MAG: hypothetical protein GX653_05955 [Clostridiales bacterium]|nr:hypothetical protein [Clostridiales bacterium]